MPSFKDISVGQIQAWIAIVVAIVAFGWNGYQFYDEAKTAHLDAAAANKTVTQLTTLVKEQQAIIKDLRETIKQMQDAAIIAQETTELNRLNEKKKNDTLENWEKFRYCDLYKKYMGPNCDVTL